MTVAKQEWLKQMEVIFEILNEGVGIADDAGHILFVNRCMERLLGSPRSTLIGKTADAFYSGEDYQFTLERMARIKAVGYDRYEFLLEPGNCVRSRGPFWFARWRLCFHCKRMGDFHKLEPFRSAALIVRLTAAVIALYGRRR